MTDHNSLVAAAEKLHELGIGTVIITPRQCRRFLSYRKEHGIVPAFKVDAVGHNSRR